MTLSGRGGDSVIDTDEQPGKAKPDKIPGLKPAFVKDGTITAANASSISDGAAALVMTRASVAEKAGHDCRGPGCCDGGPCAGSGFIYDGASPRDAQGHGQGRLGRAGC